MATMLDGIACVFWSIVLAWFCIDLMNKGVR